MTLLIGAGFLSLLLMMLAIAGPLRHLAHRGAVKGVFSFIGQSFYSAFHGLPSRKHVWGTVYDADTKRPIPFATVRLLDKSRRVLETRTTDQNGRYGFLTSPEVLMEKGLDIRLMASSPNYHFPSQRAVTIDTFLYHKPYRGEQMKISHHMLVNFDIPMDPTTSSRVPLPLKSPSIVYGIVVAIGSDVAFWLGLLAMPAGFVFSPNPFTFSALCLYLGLASLRISGVTEHPFGVIMNAKTGKPMPYALVRLSRDGGARIGFSVSDEFGRYIITAPPGKAIITAATPADIQPPRHTEHVIVVKRGWVTEKIEL